MSGMIETCSSKTFNHDMNINRVENPESRNVIFSYNSRFAC
jgi:hypothetical protein